MDRELLKKAESGDYDASLEVCKRLLIDEGITGPQYLKWCILVAEKTDAAKLLENLNANILKTKLEDFTSFLGADDSNSITNNNWFSFHCDQLDVLVKGTIYKFCKGALPEEDTKIRNQEPEFLCRLGVSLFKMGYAPMALPFLEESFKLGYSSAGIVLATILSENEEFRQKHYNELYSLLSILKDESIKKDMVSVVACSPLCYFTLELFYLYGVGTPKSIKNAYDVVILANKVPMAHSWAQKELTRFSISPSGEYIYTE